jgi:MFS family permease
MEYEQRLAGNIWKYGLLLIANKRIFAAILGVYYLTVSDVTAQTIGLILLAGSVSGFIFEIPSGYVSDKIGHKEALVISRILMVVSTVFFLCANSVMLLVLGSVFLSASAAFLSGTGSAFMHETLQGLRREHEYAQVMGKVSSLGFAVPIVLMVSVPFLVSVSYKMPFVLALVIDLVGLFAALSLTVPHVPIEEIEEVGVMNFRQVICEGYQLSYFSIALFSGIVSGVLFSVSGFRAPYQAVLQVPVIWYGVLFGIGRVCASLMLAFSGRIKKHFTLPSFYLFQLVLYTLLMLVLGFVTTGWVVVTVFIIINAFQWGLTKIDEGYQLEIIKKSKFKATLLSTGSQIDLAISGIVGYSLGYAILQTSYSKGFAYLAILFVVVLVPLYVYIAKRYTAGAYGSVEVG